MILSRCFYCFRSNCRKCTNLIIRCNCSDNIIVHSFITPVISFILFSFCPWLNIRACLKKAFCKMCVTICGIFCPD
ncbi:DUF6783 domain-containing protein, partial [Blautia sp.]|uniref:DUF6783 domain-containing protein n=1 Tax=Blautia sp. TaxID=1955243 RepID=UPI003FA4CD85